MTPSDDWRRARLQAAPCAIQDHRARRTVVTGGRVHLGKTAGYLHVRGPERLRSVRAGQHAAGAHTTCVGRGNFGGGIGCRLTAARIFKR